MVAELKNIALPVPLGVWHCNFTSSRFSAGEHFLRVVASTTSYTFPVQTCGIFYFPWPRHGGGGVVAEWVRALAWTGDRVVLARSNPAAATSLQNFSNSVYPALPVSFGGDTKLLVH